MSRINFTEIAAGAADTPKDAPRGIAAAWVNYDMIGTVTRDSMNISSVTDNAVGIVDCNYASAMVNASYASTGGAVGSTGTSIVVNGPTANPATPTANYLTLVGYQTGAGYLDTGLNMGTVHGDLA